MVQKLQVINSKFQIKEIDDSFLEEVKKRSRRLAAGKEIDSCKTFWLVNQLVC